MKMPRKQSPKWDLAKAHEFSMNNRPFVKDDTTCGCFYCRKTFLASKIEEIIEADSDGLGTMICPYCGTDTVIPDGVGFPLSVEFLEAMYRRWFRTGSGIELSLPSGTIRLTLDGKEQLFDIVALEPSSPETPNLTELLKLRYRYKRNGKAHKLRLLFSSPGAESSVEPGERLEAISFYSHGGKTTLAVSGAFGMAAEYGYDYDGEYLKNGIELDLSPETKGHTVTFAVAWLKDCTEQTDTQTWLAVDSVLW